jgi:hypothetical protein
VHAELKLNVKRRNIVRDVNVEFDELMPYALLLLAVIAKLMLYALLLLVVMNELMPYTLFLLPVASLQSVALMLAVASMLSVASLLSVFVVALASLLMPKLKLIGLPMIQLFSIIAVLLFLMWYSLMIILIWILKIFQNEGIIAMIRNTVALNRNRIPLAPQNQVHLRLEIKYPKKIQTRFI